MANEFTQAKAALITILSRIDGLRAQDYAAPAPNQYPAAIVRPESREPVETLIGGAMRGGIRVELLVSAADPAQAAKALEAYIEPRGARSIEAAAAAADPTWGGKVDDSRLVTIDNIGARKRAGATCVGADFHFQFIATIRE